MSKKDRDEIRKAIDEIPGLILKERNNNSDKKSKQLDKTDNEALHQKKVWLWTGVIIFTTLVLGIWILNVKNMWQSINISNIPEKEIFDDSKDELKNIFDDLKGTKNPLEKIEDEEKKTNTLEKLKTILQKNLSTTTTSTTTTLTSTTTIENLKEDLITIVSSTKN